MDAQSSLVAADYASSSDDDEGSVPQCKRPKAADVPRLPSPPLSDDEGVAASSAKGRRVRQFSHVDGMYAVHVYVRIAPDRDFLKAIGHCAGDIVAAASSGAVHAIPSEEYHLSLSRTVVLAQAQLDGFSDALRKSLRACTAMSVDFDSEVCELSNDDRSRFFAALQVRRETASHANACKLVDAVDAVVARYDKPVFYPERRLHFSIAWSLAPLPIPLPSLASMAGPRRHTPIWDRTIGTPLLLSPRSSLTQHIDVCSVLLRAYQSLHGRFRIDRVECRIGERVSTIALRS